MGITAYSIYNSGQNNIWSFQEFKKVHWPEMNSLYVGIKTFILRWQQSEWFPRFLHKDEDIHEGPWVCAQCWPLSRKDGNK